MTALNCPNCGGGITGISPLIRSIDCPYCTSWLRLSNQLWEATPGQADPLNAPSFLKLDQYGTAPDGTQYTVRGRLRFKYGLGNWDEWWVESTHGEGFWVEEDDGTYYRHATGEEIALPDGAEAIRVGQMLTLDSGLSLFITEKYEGDIVGREGMLPVEQDIDKTLYYVDGVADDYEYSLEIDGETAYLSQSEEFDLQAIRWENA